MSFDDLIGTSDVISLDLGLTHATEHMIGAAEFDNMKVGVVIVNRVCGALIDEHALIAALESDKVYSAGPDVFETDPGPEVNPLLLANEKIVLCPIHLGC